MAILKIARMGHPVLSCPALPVADPTAPAVARLIEDMMETLEDANGAGLAAPQVHAPLRLVIFRVPPGRETAGEESADGEPAPSSDLESPTVLINPAIEPIGERMVEDLEACLSLPGLAGIVPRHDHIRYRWTDTEGRNHECEAQGFHARVVQHECDHLDGILYPMRMTDLSTLTFTSELGRPAAAEA
ncbi:MAG: peptide deformylase [Rhodospirillales bacterium]|nr:peptide deformylase [Rhodospirillales bacterium]